MKSIIIVFLFSLPTHAASLGFCSCKELDQAQLDEASCRMSHDEYLLKQINPFEPSLREMTIDSFHGIDALEKCESAAKTGALKRWCVKTGA